MLYWFSYILENATLRSQNVTNVDKRVAVEKNDANITVKCALKNIPEGALAPRDQIKSANVKTGKGKLTDLLIVSNSKCRQV